MREYIQGSTKTSKKYNLLCEFVSYTKTDNFLMPYQLNVKCLFTGKTYFFDFIRNNKKSPKVTEYLFNSESSVYLQKGDILCLDHCVLPEDGTNKIITKWVNIIRNKFKDDGREIFKAKGRLLRDKIIDKDTKEETDILRLEFLRDKQLIQFKANDFEGNLLKIAKLLSNSDNSQRRKLLMFKQGDKYNLLYQFIKVSDNDNVNTVINNIDDICAKLLEYSKSYLAEYNKDTLVEVYELEQRFLGQMYKNKLNVKYTKRLDHLLNLFNSKKVTQSKRYAYENVNDCYFTDCFYSVAKRENGTEYVNYFDLYSDLQEPVLLKDIKYFKKEKI